MTNNKPGPWSHKDERIAIARLGAAAPYLLEACQLALLFIVNGVALGFIQMPDPELDDPANQTEAIIRAAIAKATGGAE